MLSGEFKRYIKNPWNIFDQLMFIILLVAIILRFTLTSDENFVWARYVYIINLVMFYMRILQLYYIHPHLGPKVIVIWRMVRAIINEEGRYDKLLISAIVTISVKQWTNSILSLVYFANPCPSFTADKKSDMWTSFSTTFAFQPT